MQDTAEGLTVRQYARQEGISIQAAYRRLWEGRAKGNRFSAVGLCVPDSTKPPKSEIEIEMTT